MTSLTAPCARAIRGAPAIRSAAALIGLCGSSAAHAQSHAEQLNLYARVLSATSFAEQACPGFRANAPRLAFMRDQFRISATDDLTIADRIRESTASISSAYARAGQSAWCADTYRLFGPDGTLVRGALGEKR